MDGTRPGRLLNAAREHAPTSFIHTDDGLGGTVGNGALDEERWSTTSMQPMNAKRGSQAGSRVFCRPAFAFQTVDGT